MIIEPTLAYTVIFITVALILLCVAVLAMYLNLINKYMRLKTGGDDKADPQKVLQAAQAKSAQILDEAQKVLVTAHSQATAVINNSQEYLKLNDAELVKAVDKATQVYAAKYQEMLNLTHSESIKLFQNIPNEVRNALGTELSKINQILQSQLLAASSDAKKIVEGAYSKAEAEVENYKKERLKQVEDSLILILENVSRKVLAKEITAEEHAKLVIKALEEAKRQGIFDSK